MSDRSDGGMSLLEFHVLLALANGPLYGYAIRDAVAAESDGSLTPRAGSLYRVIARMMTWGLVSEAEPAEPLSPHPGLARKYYGLTAEGRSALAAEARRQKSAAALAEERLGAVGRS
ncbi:MAG TPA: PadR family transcriptional regulator [Longimicrobiales bacterium]|nr:PadR family transcriptional regulator [Longimicrobiales bacterium]